MADTKIRTIRISDELWDNAKAQAARDGTDLSSLIRTWLTVYARPRNTLPTVAKRLEPQRRHAGP